MLPFFRKIRYRLANENQFFKYSRYAIGEIVLVVIGILIALYINQWNKTRLDIQFEKVILSGIQKDLQNEITSLRSHNKGTVERVNRISTLDSLLQGEMPVYHKSFDTLFGAVWGLHLWRMDNKAKYENLKSKGLNTIQVDSIREQLILVYETVYPGFEGHLEIELFQHENVLHPYYLKHFSNLSFSQSATPIDFESVWKDVQYHNIVSYRLKVFQVNQFRFYPSALQEMERLQRMIDHYLNEEN